MTVIIEVPFPLAASKDLITRLIFHCSITRSFSSTCPLDMAAYLSAATELASYDGLPWGRWREEIKEILPPLTAEEKAERITPWRRSVKAKSERIGKAIEQRKQRQAEMKASDKAAGTGAGGDDDEDDGDNSAVEKEEPPAKKAKVAEAGASSGSEEEGAPAPAKVSQKNGGVAAGKKAAEKAEEKKAAEKTGEKKAAEKAGEKKAAKKEPAAKEAKQEDSSTAAGGKKKKKAAGKGKKVKST
mmetsp:Transcript_96339/g.257653  ORF Transcript_96339/g.257653 Transcript_96339/m.257653 type:complete len:243 (+) Transcript_96339:1496-2224(+)